MKPYQKVIVVVIVILGMINYLPPIMEYFKREPKVKVGQVWQTNTKTLYFMNNAESGEMISMSFKKVIKVNSDNDSVYYYCSKSKDFSECVEVFSDNIDGFTFSSEAWRTNLIDQQ
jgi:hypothetical protein